QCGGFGATDASRAGAGFRADHWRHHAPDDVFERYGRGFFSRAHGRGVGGTTDRRRRVGWRGAGFRDGGCSERRTSVTRRRWRGKSLEGRRSRGGFHVPNRPGDGDHRHHAHGGGADAWRRAGWLRPDRVASAQAALADIPAAALVHFARDSPVARGAHPAGARRQIVLHRRKRRRIYLSIGSTQAQIQPEEGSPERMVFFIEGEATLPVGLSRGRWRGCGGATAGMDDLDRRWEANEPT